MRGVVVAASLAFAATACSSEAGVHQDLELLPTGLSCDVVEVLQHHCLGCHGSPPINGAPVPLVSYDDLTRPAPDVPDLSIGQVALERMTDPQRPMPPPPADPVDGDHYAVFKAWVEGGMPRGSCAPPPSQGHIH